MNRQNRLSRSTDARDERKNNLDVTKAYILLMYREILSRRIPTKLGTFEYRADVINLQNFLSIGTLLFQLSCGLITYTNTKVFIPSAFGIQGASIRHFIALNTSRVIQSKCVNELAFAIAIRHRKVFIFMLSFKVPT
jgi:hypothetical protein